MPRLDDKTISIIKDSIKKNRSLNQIADEFSVNKSTVYYWYRKMKPRKYKKVNISTKCEEKIGEFIGMFAGDGNYTVDKNYRHQIRVFINGKDLRYASHVSNIFEHICEKKPYIYHHQKDNVITVRIISKDLLNFLNKYLTWDKPKVSTIRLKYHVGNYSREFLTGFLRGLIDTDGYIGKNIVTFSTISNKLAKNTESSLRISGIDYKKYIYRYKKGNRKPIIKIRVIKDFEKLIKTIKPIHYSKAQVV